MPAIVHVAVMNGTKQLGYPKWPLARPGECVSISDVFTRRYDYDAFALAHAIPEGLPAYRLTKDYPGELTYVLLFADLDAHKLTGDALDAWKETEAARARVMGGCLIYKTRSGVRLVWQVEILGSAFYEFTAKAWYLELERRGFLGVDHTAGSFGRHMRLPFVKRDGKDETPVLEGALAPLDFDPGPFTPRAPRKARPRATKSVSASWGPDDPVLAIAISEGKACHVGRGVYAVYCPTERHNGGALTSTTAILPDGRFKCMKASCGHVTYSDWAATIIPPAQPVTATPRALLETLKAGGIRGQLSAVDLTTGAGKSHETRRHLPPGAIHEGIKNVLLSKTNDLATQHRLACGAHQAAGVDVPLPERGGCVQPKTVKALRDAGVSSKYACMNCPSREGCTVAEGVGDKLKGEVSSHAMLHRYG